MFPHFTVRAKETGTNVIQTVQNKLNHYSEQCFKLVIPCSTHGRG